MLLVSAIKHKDFYKTDHRNQYPKDTTKVYSNWTARISRIPGVDKVVVFGMQYFIQKYLLEEFQESFFEAELDEVISDYRRRMDTSLGPNAVKVDHLIALHKLGYLPLVIKALPEGTLAPLRIPIFTITNTLPEFSWLPNFLETLLSNALWHPMTSATIAFEYRKILELAAKETSDIPEFVKWQGHDFSMRGQSSLDSAMASGAAHLLSFTGTDTIPAIDWLEYYYVASAASEMIGGSVPATEHSVMCLGGKETEYDTYKRLITEVYPSGIVSIVSDTWDYFKLLQTTILKLKPEIMARDGKVVIRPDSGDPYKIICGDEDAPPGSAEYRGTVEILWEIFGGTVNSKGYKQLDPHIGCIYGDSITLDKCRQIVEGLKRKKFASTNMVFGIGSYTYQYVTRDTLGFAMKATYGEVGGQPREIFKDPVTDGGVKKSAKGLLRVNEDLTLSECVTPEEESTGLLQEVFRDGVMSSQEYLSQIRFRIDTEIKKLLN